MKISVSLVEFDFVVDGFEDASPSDGGFPEAARVVMGVVDFDDFARLGASADAACVARVATALNGLPDFDWAGFSSDCDAWSVEKTARHRAALETGVEVLDFDDETSMPCSDFAFALRRV